MSEEISLSEETSLPEISHLSTADLSSKLESGVHAVMGYYYDVCAVALE